MCFWFGVFAFREIGRRASQACVIGNVYCLGGIRLIKPRILNSYGDCFSLFGIFCPDDLEFSLCFSIFGRLFFCSFPSSHLCFSFTLLLVSFYHSIKFLSFSTHLVIHSGPWTPATDRPSSADRLPSLELLFFTSLVFSRFQLLLWLKGVGIGLWHSRPVWISTR